MQEGVIDDVTGWALLIEYIGVGVGWVLVFMMIVFSVILFIYAMLLFLLAWCARRCFSKGMRKIKQYRILMGIEYALQSIIEAILIVYVLIGEAHWGFWIPTIALLAAIVYSAVNTYTNRIMS